MASASRVRGTRSASVPTSAMTAESGSVDATDSHFEDWRVAYTRVEQGGIGSNRERVNTSVIIGGGGCERDRHGF